MIVCANPFDGKTDTELDDPLNYTCAGFPCVWCPPSLFKPICLIYSVILNCNAYLDGQHSGPEMCQVHYTYYEIQLSAFFILLSDGALGSNQGTKTVTRPPDWPWCSAVS